MRTTTFELGYEIQDPFLAYNPPSMVHTTSVLIISKGISHAQQ